MLVAQVYVITPYFPIYYWGREGTENLSGLSRVKEEVCGASVN